MACGRSFMDYLLTGHEEHVLLAHMGITREVADDELERMRAGAVAATATPRS